MVGLVRRPKADCDCDCEKPNLRALAGAAYVGGVVVLVRGVVRDLPRGVGRWGRGLFRRSRWQGKYLLALVGLLSVAVLVMSFAPYAVAAGAGLALAAILRTVGIICVVGWVVLALVNLVRGR